MAHASAIAQRLGADSTLGPRTDFATPIGADDTLFPFSLLGLCKKKVTAAFDAGKRLGLIDTLAALIPGHRDPNLITHSIAGILRGRVIAIACGYPHANDLDTLHQDPAFKTWMPASVGMTRRCRRSVDVNGGWY